MPATIASADLRLMTDAERSRLLEAAFHTAPDALENYLAVLDARLRVFEQRYEMPSSVLGDALADGRLRDTKEVSEWMFWARLRDDLIARKARP